MLESLHNNLFTYKKLTEEEQTQRGILGRLVGVIADTQAPTRNGRLYGEDLWENVFKDPIMLEKIENRCCFGELGHPADREEVDPEKIAICLAEIPKKGRDGKLYGVFDILNTPCGKILKSLCDYGANIGVSSRGSGDVMPNDEVDPDTYCCECWDAVLVPAVKAARQQYVTEALDTKSLKLRHALTESYNASSENDKKIMKEALDNLDIKLDESEDDEIPEAKHVEGYELSEAKKSEDEDAKEEKEEKSDDKKSKKKDKEDDKKDDKKDKSKEDESEPEDEFTVGNFIKELKEFDKDLVLEFKPIVIDGVEYAIDNVSFDDESESGKVIFEIGYNSEMSDNKKDEEPVDVDNVEVAEVEAAPGEPVEKPEEAIDDGLDGVLENLKEAIRQKDLLEQEIKTLKNSQTVRDSEVSKLKEELNKYKVAYARTSEIAATAKTAKQDVQKLQEKLEKQNEHIKELESVKANTVALTESANSNALKVKRLTEALNSKQEELEKKENELTEQRASFNKKINESIANATNYKNKLAEAVNKYIESKANMLGVRTTEITSRLDTKFSMNDIDKVCDKLLSESVSWNSGRLPQLDKGSFKVRINEARDTRPSMNNKKNFEDECFEDLLELAGLK